MTRRLYLQDPYTSSFEADIVEIRETQDGPALIFAETYFYPESGGQPFDLGTIDGVPVTKILETDDDAVLHVVETVPGATRVHCEIDADRRRDHMQQHSGQHILSAAFATTSGAQTTSFHLGANVSTIDLDKSPLTVDDIERAERAANDVARRGVSIRSRIVSRDEARELELRKPPPAGDALRIVEIDGFDQQACCGTHPRSSSEVAPIVVRSSEKIKGGSRIVFLCGGRAIADYRDTVSRIRSLTSVLSSTEAGLVDTAARLQDERKSMGKELRKLRSQTLSTEAESWMDESTEHGSMRVLAKRCSDLDPTQLRALATRLVETSGRIVLLGSVAHRRAHLVFARSEDVGADMGALIRGAIGAVDGRGGGSPAVAQGGGPNTEGLDEALTAAMQRIVT